MGRDGVGREHEGGAGGAPTGKAELWMGKGFYWLRCVQRQAGADGQAWRLIFVALVARDRGVRMCGGWEGGAHMFYSSCLEFL